MLLPRAEHFLALAGIGSDADRAAAMVEHDAQRGEIARHVREFGQLRKVHPGVEHQPRLGHARQSGTERRLVHQPRGGPGMRRVQLAAAVPGGAEAHAAKARARRAMGVQHRRHGGAEAQVGETDDAGGDPHVRRLRGCGELVHALGLADRPQFGRALVAVEHRALDVHGARYAVSAMGVGDEVLDQVAAVRVDPQVMMRIADRQIRIECGLGAERQPGVAVVHGRGATVPGRSSRAPASD